MSRGDIAKGTGLIRLRHADGDNRVRLELGGDGSAMEVT
jgi:hypothetical protein